MANGISDSLLNAHRWSLASALENFLLMEAPHAYSRDQITYLVAELRPHQVEAGDIEGVAMNFEARFGIRAQILSTPPNNDTSAIAFLDGTGWCVVSKAPSSGRHLVQRGHQGITTKLRSVVNRFLFLVGEPQSDDSLA